jgi:pathogen-inducible salicylic acid glucosyltransferase
MEGTVYRGHCLVLTYPSQGHINPMMQFSKRLEHKGVKVTLVITNFISKTMHKEASSNIALETISDGYDEGGIAEAESAHGYLDRFRRVGSQTLTQLIEKLSSSGGPVDCVVYDPFLPWALDIAKKFGLVGAVLFTQSCAVDNIYYHVHKGVLKVPLSETEILLPGLPPLQPQDMPSFIYDFGSDPAYYDTLVGQFHNFDKADWVLVNTFYELEQEVKGLKSSRRLFLASTVFSLFYFFVWLGGRTLKSLMILFDFDSM